MDAERERNRIRTDLVFIADLPSLQEKYAEEGLIDAFL